jgi:predicted nucleic acid-binding protein
MPFVLDASVTIAWAFEDEDRTSASRVLLRMRTDEARVPGLWWYEVRNALIVNERRGRLVEADTLVFLRALRRLTVSIDHAAEEAQVLALARRHGLTVYDAAYLELAEREGIALATLDTTLARAASAERVEIL